MAPAHFHELFTQFKKLVHIIPSFKASWNNFLTFLKKILFSEGSFVQKRLQKRVAIWLLHPDLKEKMPLPEKKKKIHELSQRLDLSQKS